MRPNLIPGMAKGRLAAAFGIATLAWTQRWRALTMQVLFLSADAP